MTARQQDDDVDRFGRWAGSYDRSILQRLLFAPVQRCTFEHAVSLHPDPRAVLDVGAGPARSFTESLAVSHPPRSRELTPRRR